MKRIDYYTLGWCAFWILALAGGIALIVGCAPDKAATSGVAAPVNIDNPQAPVTVENKPTTNTDHDMSDTQRKAQQDSQLTLYAMAIGGLCIGLALPSFSPWWVNLVVGCLGVAFIGLPFIRAW